MFQQQLLKLVNRLIDMTEAELTLIKSMDLKAAARLTDEKEPLVKLYQECVHKVQSDAGTKAKLKSWPQFQELKDQIFYLNELSQDYETWIKRIEKSQHGFVEKMQEKMLNVMQPVKSYNKSGHMNSRQAHYIKQGGGSLATLDQSL